MMDFLSLCAERYSVRKFKDEPVNPQLVAQILTTGILAPTAANRQPQRILVLDQKDQIQVLKDCTPYLFDAPLLFVICYHQEKAWKRKYDGHHSGEVDASIVTTHMMLAAASLGLGTTWVMHFDPEKLVQALQLPAELTPVALLPCGIPAEDAEPSPLHAKRLPLDETVYAAPFPWQ